MAKKKKTIKKRTRRKPVKKSLFSPLAIFLRFITGIITKNIYLIIVGVVLLVALKGAYEYVSRSDYFVAKEVEMININGDDAGSVEPAIRLRIEGNRNIFKIDLKSLQYEITESHPELKNIKVNRVLPDRIQVFYKRRVPVCQARTSSRYFLISKDAVVLLNPKKYGIEGLIIVSGVFIEDSRLPKDRKLHAINMHVALRLIQQIKETGFAEKYPVEEIDVTEEYNPIMLLKNGINIKVGKRNFKRRAAALLKVLEDLEKKELKPKFIDIRFEDIIVTPR